MRSEPLARKTNYLMPSNNDHNNNNTVNSHQPVFKRSKSSLSANSSVRFDLVPDSLLRTGSEGDGMEFETAEVPYGQRSNSLSTLCAAMFTEWDSQDYLESFFSQLLEIEGSAHNTV